MKRFYPYSLSEEITNVATHGVGIVMSLVVCIIFLVKGAQADSWLVNLSFALYMFGVVSSYTASTVYHAIPSTRQKSKAIARKLDHAAIYWHIAGSYSPLTIIAFRGGGEEIWAWIIFGFVWLCAIVGTSLSFRKMKAQSYLETSCYVLMGLTVLVAFKPFYDSCGLAVVLWVAAEGVAYITGAVLYSFKKVKFMHSIFHVFVLFGDVFHMIATWKVIEMFIK